MLKIIRRKFRGFSLPLLVAILTMLAMLAYSFKVHEIYDYIFPAMIITSLITTNLIRPAIPLVQLGALAAIIIAVHAIFHYGLAHLGWPAPFYLLADKVIEVICVFGFGAYWTNKGYISSKDNE